MDKIDIKKVVEGQMKLLSFLMDEFPCGTKEEIETMIRALELTMGMVIKRHFKEKDFDLVMNDFCHNTKIFAKKGGGDFIFGNKGKMNN